MKNCVLLLVCFLSCQSIFAGGFRFPNLNYEYARVYLFNCAGNEQSRPESFIYRDGIYAASKLGDGWPVSADQMNQINSVFHQGVDLLVSGLASCFIPRHGIIFFDKAGKPLASLSICFECMQLNFWSSVPLDHTFENFEASEKAIKNAEKQFQSLRTIFQSTGAPAYDNPVSYKEFVKANDSLFSCSGEMIFDYSQQSLFEKTNYSLQEVKTWNKSSTTAWKEQQQTIVNETENTKIEIPVLTLGTDTEMIFGRSDYLALSDASIHNPALILPNGISVGMSLDQVQATFLVWDGIAYPSSIVVNYKDATIRYKFQKRTLVSIEFSIY